GYSFICPMAGHDGGEIEVQTRAMLPASASVNHIAPSGPAVIRCAPLAGVGIGYSVTDPAKGQFAEAVVTQILPIWFADCSMNHIAPSAPDQIAIGKLFAVVTG